MYLLDNYKCNRVTYVTSYKKKFEKISVRIIPHIKPHMKDVTGKLVNIAITFPEAQ